MKTDTIDTVPLDHVHTFWINWFYGLVEDVFSFYIKLDFFVSEI